MLSKTLENGEPWKLMKMTIAENKKGCIEATYSFECTELSKHNDVKFQLVVDRVAKGIIGLQYVPTDMMVAEIYTKNMKRVKFSKLMKFRKALRE